MLFAENIYGPIRSRRLGVSLGINLMLSKAKVCSFNCVYCECGWNTGSGGENLPTRAYIATELKRKLAELEAEGTMLDVITFSGNGEPTMHPDFEGIIEDTLALRDRFCPRAKVTVLSNSTQLHRPEVVRGLMRVDNRLLKLDAGIEHTMRQIDQPIRTDFTVDRLMEQLCAFEGDLTIQTIFLRGTHQGEVIDNTTPAEVEAWMAALRKIKPKQVMIYAVDRATPVEGLEKLTREELEVIANKAREEGFEVNVSA